MKIRPTGALIVGALSLAMVMLSQGSASANPMQTLGFTEPAAVEVVTANNPMQRLGVDSRGGYEHGPVTPKAFIAPDGVATDGVTNDQVAGQ
ncbi:hypothetical protein [Umezawaea sp. Da 62-37]|uniref:hypothetical protein n=1 Tax=Umezawaea sp. Da 62-37 TaxID=3075927 RepID=UPI0028F7491F|nr:hypothetical protein [Umezawaea sp. Da 62-37]WNV82248.1 hypothetical protein RM788_29020 [Umezawaea sp. Da 62-37]